MKKYCSRITLTQTSRGVWGLDTVKGCKYGMQNYKNGCYGVCYGYSASIRYGYDFSNSTIRRFESEKHMQSIISKIKAIENNFIRIGVMGDPSECWGHTIEICDKIKSAGKKIVVITKHWEPLPSYLYKKAIELKLIINTSISALDSDSQIEHRLNEYRKLKKICTSVLRIVSCDFNLNSIYGIICNKIQETLFDNENVIDTVLRVPDTHNLVENGIINTMKLKFLSTDVTVSARNKNTYFGYCKDCPEMCGVNL